MKDSPERIAHELAQAKPGWRVTIRYRNGHSARDAIAITATLIGVGTDLRKLRGDRRYAIIHSGDLSLGIIVVPFPIILHASAYPPDTQFTPGAGTARDA